MSAILSRLQRFSESDDASVLLETAADDEANQLFEFLRADGSDLAARHLLGLLYWYRYQVRPAGHDEGDLGVLQMMLVPSFVSGVGEVPPQLRPSLAVLTRVAAEGMLLGALDTPGKDLASAAVDLWQRIVDALSDHPERGALLSNLALAWQARIANLDASGTYRAALELQRKVTDAREQALGPEHPDTLAARHKLAELTARVGDPISARNLFAELLPVLERVLGREHPGALAARHNLAYSTEQAGDPATARDMYAALLPVRARVLGEEHPDTLVTRHNLAYSIGDAGDPAAARDMCAVLLAVCARVLGDEHPDTLDARAGLAKWTGESGDPAAARDMYAALLPVRSRVSGSDHPETVAVGVDLAHWTRKACDV